MTWRPVDLDPLAIVMVGKPARGKTFTARRLARYANWLGYHSRVFNVGAYRRDRLGAGHDASFFDPANAVAVGRRTEMAKAAVSDLIEFLGTGGEVGVLDATNSTRARRAWVRRACEQAGVAVVFVEVVCEDLDVIKRNVLEVKVHGPDYRGVPAAEAAADFLERIVHYDRVYETLDDAKEGGDLSYVRLEDLGERIELRRIHGYLPGLLVSFLMHLHDRKRTILLTRHGETVANVTGRIGGDTPLSPRGEQFAERLGAWVRDRFPPDVPLTVWTSTLQRTVQTAQHIGRPVRSWKLLDEIDAGDCDGMTYSEIAEQLPLDYAQRQADKFRYRYPRGESYQDLIARLEPVILELERQQLPVLVIAHQAVLRALSSYLLGTPPEDCPQLRIPLHAVMEATPGPYGSDERWHPLGPDAVET